ncbi:hypothetical protein [Miniimonas sp. S16]|uniref:hypothetical protein n=1 Tax=Miniimonas sp. S16 TaxID=2171623 RepID=UPI000D5275B7|nr:hypothetical protein [Miniimonas sp. S16]
MSTTPPDRSIAGLAPRTRRTPAAASLLRENRPDPAPAPAAADASSDVPAAGLEQTREERPASTARAQISVVVAPELRDRARAAFRAASYFEHVGSFAEFVAGAIEAEITRIEREHNAGLPLEPVRENLPAGRAGSR